MDFMCRAFWQTRRSIRAVEKLQQEDRSIRGHDGDRILTIAQHADFGEVCRDDLQGV